MQQRWQCQQVKQACRKQAGARGRTSKVLWAEWLLTQLRIDRSNKSQRRTHSLTMADTERALLRSVRDISAQSRLPSQTSQGSRNQRFSCRRIPSGADVYMGDDTSWLPSVRVCLAELIQSDQMWCLQPTHIPPPSLQQALQEGHWLLPFGFSKQVRNRQVTITELCYQQSMAELG